MVIARGKRRRRSTGGFTLIELLIAAALSTVGLLGLLALQTIAIRGNMMSRNFGEAVGIAQQRLEVAQETLYANLSGLAEVGTANIDPTTDAVGATTQSIYTRATAVAVDGVNNITTITVTVSWKDTAAANHSISVLDERSP